MANVAAEYRNKVAASAVAKGAPTADCQSFRAAASRSAAGWWESAARMALRL
jgi:hypothetical protein